MRILEVLDETLLSPLVMVQNGTLVKPFFWTNFMVA
jgi:hypothetical protein